MLHTHTHPLHRWPRHTKRVSTGLGATAIVRAKIHKFCFSEAQKKSGDESSDEKPCCDDVVANSSFEPKCQMAQTVAVSHWAMGGMDFRAAWGKSHMKLTTKPLKLWMLRTRTTLVLPNINRQNQRFLVAEALNEGLLCPPCLRAISS